MDSVDGGGQRRAEADGSLRLGGSIFSLSGSPDSESGDIIRSSQRGEGQGLQRGCWD